MKVVGLAEVKCSVFSKDERGRLGKGFVGTMTPVIEKVKCSVFSFCKIRGCVIAWRWFAKDGEGVGIAKESGFGHHAG